MKLSKLQLLKSSLKLLLPMGALLLSACSMNPLEGSESKFTSHYDRSQAQVNGFDVRSVTQAPEQITLMFRIDVAPQEAFNLVADIDKMATWFTDIKNPKMDNTLSTRGTNLMGTHSVRTCSLDDEMLYEDIVHFDEKNMSYAYAIDMDKSTVSFPISNQLGLFTVETDGGSGSLVTWRIYYDKNFHIVAPVLTIMMKNMILEPAVENLFKLVGGEWVEPNQA